MSELLQGGGGLRPSPSPSSFPFLEMDPTADLLRYSNSDSAFQGTNFFLFPQEVVPLQLQPQEDVSGVVVPGGAMNRNNHLGGNSHVAGDDDCRNDRKRKKRENKKKSPLELSQGSSPISSARAKRIKHGSKIGKGDYEGGDMERKEVVHVRARRGQATDSHSLAERVRRGKINERLRCLQDIVPGCYKTMGLAVMLDEIISYVQSLQHQVDFLSMKLTAASSFYNFNSESDLIDVMRRAKAYEAKEMEKLLMKSQLEGNSVTTTTFHPFEPIS